MKTTDTAPQPEPFKNLVDLMALYSDATHRLDEMEAGINQELLALIDDKRTDYSELQKVLTESETALELIARSHPEWFSEKRSIKTPYGAVKFHKATKTVIKNEELTILLIEQEAAKNPAFDKALYLRETKALNLEALEKLDDAALKQFRVQRLADDSFSVLAAKVNLGKAVKEAAEKEAVPA